MATTVYGPTTGLPARSRWAGLTANASGVYIIWFRDVLRFWRDRVRLVDPEDVYAAVLEVVS